MHVNLIRYRLPWLRFAVATMLVLAASASGAADFPTRPVRMIVPYVQGGSYDPIVRFLAQLLQPKLGQTVIVENKTGGDLVIGAQAVLQAPRDGHTLYTAGASITTWKIFNKGVPVDAQRDFLPVSAILEIPGSGIMINSAVPAKTLQEFISYARANPGKLNYGHASRALMLVSEWLKQVEGLNIVPVPYKGGGDALAAVIGNNVQMVVDNPAQYREFVKSGKIRILAYTGKERLSLLPDVPTAEESGVKGGLHAPNWLGVMAAAGTSPEIIDRLNKEIVASVKTREFADFVTKLMAGGGRSLGTSPLEFAGLIDADIKRWANIAKGTNIQPE